MWPSSHTEVSPFSFSPPLASNRTGRLHLGRGEGRRKGKEEPETGKLLISYLCEGGRKREGGGIEQPSFSPPPPPFPLPPSEFPFHPRVLGGLERGERDSLILPDYRLFSASASAAGYPCLFPLLCARAKILSGWICSGGGERGREKSSQGHLSYFPPSPG